MDNLRIRHIFFPHADEKSIEVQGKARRFVYYTTAETAFRIIERREIWMRNTSTMNDFMEVEHGFACLNFAYKSASGKQFVSALEDAFPGVCEETVALFNQWLPNIRGSTFIMCFSEHLDDEDANGRLSMWRAYGGNTGVAIVINGATLFNENPGTGLVASPSGVLDSATSRAGTGPNRRTNSSRYRLRSNARASNH